MPIIEEAISNKNILINIHNHPRDSFISNSDIKLLTNKNISAIHIISGNRILIFEKLEKFDLVEFNKLFNNELANLLINKDKNYSNDFYENKFIQNEIQIITEYQKNILLEMIKLDVRSQELGSDKVEAFDDISDLMIRMNIKKDDYYDAFEIALNDTINILQNKNKIIHKEISF